MKEKVILICIDGMRPDGFLTCGNPFIHDLMKLGSYCLDSQAVFPSSTLPCHMSMFHSVPTERHGILSNTYVPMVRPVSGLFEQIKLMGGISDMYFGWEPLRDIGQPKSLARSSFIHARGEDDVDNKLTDMALSRIRDAQPDFVFLYLVETDEKGGHDHGWMSEEYLKCVNNAIDNVKRVYETVQEVAERTGISYSIVITADHGGHDRIHGTTMKEDMTIPTFFIGKSFEPGKELSNVSILDLAPTIVDLMGVPKAPEWEGKSLISQ